MPRKEKPSYVVELALDATPSDDRRLGGVFSAATRLTNVLLQDGRGIVEALREDTLWAAARAMPKSTSEQRKARAEAFTAVRRAHGFSEYDFHHSAVVHKNAAGFDDRLGAHVTQKIGTKVFLALEQYLLGKRGLPRFKGHTRPVHSIEGKNNETMLRWDPDAMFLVLAPSWGLRVKELRLRSDEWLWHALQGEVKYCRLVWRNVGEHRHYYAQLVFDGKPPQKSSVLDRMARKGSKAGIDIGPSVLAWCTATDAGLLPFCADVDLPLKQVRVLQRQVDRQRRANNPDKFDEKGRFKKSRTRWTSSARQRRVEARLRKLQTKTAGKRKNAHGRDINNLLSKARAFRHDGVSVKFLQKNYGRSIGARAPGLFMSELKRKAERAGAGSSSINVRQLKTSQYDHSTGECVKKPLSQRWHVFGDGRGQVQRDVYSAFLALHAQTVTDADGVITWSHDRKKLQAAWRKLEPALRAQGLFKEIDNVSREQKRGQHCPPSRLGLPVDKRRSTKVFLVPGSQARGVARVEIVPTA